MDEKRHLLTAKVRIWPTAYGAVLINTSVLSLREEHTPAVAGEPYEAPLWALGYHLSSVGGAAENCVEGGEFEFVDP